MYGFLVLQDNTGEGLRDSLISEFFFFYFRLYLAQIRHYIPILHPVSGFRVYCDFVAET